MLFFDFGWWGVVIFLILNGFLDFWIFGDFPIVLFLWSKPEPSEPELMAVGTGPKGTEPWVSCSLELTQNVG